MSLEVELPGGGREVRGVGGSREAEEGSREAEEGSREGEVLAEDSGILEEEVLVESRDGGADDGVLAEGRAMGNNSGRRRLTRGGRNLVWLGLGASAIAVATTALSLILYHNSGDIYLDRSRPGFLPEEAEEVLTEEEQYKFSENGGMSAGVLKEYLRNLREEQGTLEGVGEAYGEAPLSDESLGIPVGEEEEVEEE